jgi:type IV pilus assembly protein PilA
VFIALRTRLNDDEDGFTLIELLVVVIIIGILAAIAVPTFLSQREKAANSAQQADLRNAAVAEESYFTDNGAGGSGSYPTSAQLTSTTGGGFKKSTAVQMWAAGGNTYCLATHHPTSRTWYRLTNTDGAPVATAAADPTAALAAASNACAGAAVVN